MGKYLNIGNAGFKEIRQEKYVDKTGMIAFTNSIINTTNKCVCVSRPRRFGKSYTAKMLAAYYDKSCDSKELFDKTIISSDKDFQKFLNKYNVIYIDITLIIGNYINSNETEDIVVFFQKEIKKDLKNENEFIDENKPLSEVLFEIAETKGDRFIFIIDEWDAMFREFKENQDILRKFVNLLRALFKSPWTDRTIDLVYMTGILPIKKYNTQSAMTNFNEYTMLSPKKLATYIGFTENEVKELCNRYNMDFHEMKSWYDGYSFFKEKSIYNPNAVIQAINNEEYGSYWSQTESYESIKQYINMNMDGLKDAIISMIAGNKVEVMSRSFQNDMTNIKSKDDVLTLLIHLGYLAYDQETEECYIPNKEISNEMKNAVGDSGWENISNALLNSKELLENTIAGKIAEVSKALDNMHTESTSILSYNNENSLSCTIALAYYYARKDYIMIRELPTGKGYADIVFIPRKNKDLPALLIELKWNYSAKTAIRQIREKNYPEVLKDYVGNILLVGITYNKKTKKHNCKIEKA